MQMKNPPHPGELIGDSIEELGVSIREAARGLGITRQQLHNIIVGRSAITFPPVSSIIGQRFSVFSASHVLIRD